MLLSDLQISTTHLVACTETISTFKSHNSEVLYQSILEFWSLMRTTLMLVLGSAICLLSTVKLMKPKKSLSF